MSRPSALNGKDLKTPNISKTQISESLITGLFPDPKSLSKGLQSTCSKIEIQFSDIKIKANVQSKMHKNAWNISPNTFKSPFRTARVDPKKPFSSQTLSVQTTFSHTPKPMAPPSSCAEEFITARLPPDWVKFSQTKIAPAVGRQICLVGENQRRKSPKLYKSRSRPQKRIQGAAITTDHSTSAVSWWHLDGDASAHVDKVLLRVDWTCVGEI